MALPPRRKSSDAPRELKPRKAVVKPTDDDAPVRSKKSSHTPRGLGFFKEMVEDGTVLVKILGGAGAGAMMAVIARAKMSKGGNDVSFVNTPAAFAIFIIASAAIGAVLGGLFAARDTVHERLAARRSVPLPLKLLFAYGAVSYLLWAPIAIFVIIAILFMVF